MDAIGMDARLTALFDRQRKVNDPHLARLIGQTQARWGAPLTDEDLTLVAAAGEPDVPAGKEPWKTGG